MRHCVLLLAALAAAISAVPANATMRITADRGGLIVSYAERFAAARASGEPVVIDGACLSACTLVLGILPRNQVCATRRAVLGFHAAWRPTADGDKTASPGATQAMYDIYPAPVQEWITRRGGLTPHMIFLQGRELAAMVPTCSGGAAPRVASSGPAHVVRHYPTSRVLAAQPLR
jgi:hypothetical protein